MQVDSKTAELIVDIYRNIQSVQHVLKTTPFSGSEILVQSGNVLDALMNQALAIDSIEMMLKKISLLTKYVKELKKTNQSLTSPIFQENLNHYLDQISSDLETLKMKIK